MNMDQLSCFQERAPSYRVAQRINGEGVMANFVHVTDNFIKAF